MNTIALSANTSWYLFNFRKSTITALVEQGFRVIVIAPKDEYSIKFEALGARFIHVNIDQGGTNPFNDIRTTFEFYRIYSSNDINVVLNFTPKNNIYSTLAASIFGIRVINNIAGLGSLFISESITSKIARSLYRVSQRFANKIFFQNNDDRELFVARNIVDPDLTDRLPGSGVDLRRFSIVNAPDDNVTRFLLMARMLYDKGIIEYVESAKILKAKYGNKVEFNLLGFLDVNNPSSVTRSQMEEWVTDGFVNYLGVSDSVENEIGFVDCVVLPSFYREGVPKSLLEAGSMGKPIVTTDNVGCRETVDDGINGFICEPRSISSLTQALDNIILMPYSQRLEMGLASRRKMEAEFNEKIVIDKYISAINSLL